MTGVGMLYGVMIYQYTTLERANGKQLLLAELVLYDLVRSEPLDAITASTRF